MKRVVSGVFDSFDEAEFAAREVMGFGLNPQDVKLEPDHGGYGAAHSKFTAYFAPNGVQAGATSGGIMSSYVGLDGAAEGSGKTNGPAGQVHWSVECDESFCNKVAEMVRHKGGHRVDVQ